jgi:AcrR family transcriptional regulator
VAAELRVRPPSLYNHVSGLDGLRRDLALRGVSELGERIRDAAVGRAGADALTALAGAYRAYARERPGLYRALQRAPDAGDSELAAAAVRLLQPVLAVLAGFGLEGDAAIHAARSLRSAMHGFVELERLGGFGLDVDLDASYDWMIATFSAGMHGYDSGP